MADTETLFTHFGSSTAELPAEYYLEIGRAFYRWSQLEGSVCTLATSIMAMPWLDAMDRLVNIFSFRHVHDPITMIHELVECAEPCVLLTDIFRDTLAGKPPTISSSS